MKSTLTQDRELAQRLTRTWPVFFQRFGRLTEVQRAVIPKVLDGHDVLVCAPTASGKTEAASAPLVERHIERKEPWSILYVSPTRALVNDLYERLEPPLEALSLRVVRRTGDHRSDLSQHPHLILITPESFDSLLCRGRQSQAGHVLARVVAVVLDEIHLVAGNARGEQLRWLNHRLKKLRRYARSQGWTSTDEVQLIALSATVQEPQNIAMFFELGQHVVEVSGHREIETVRVDVALPSICDALPIYLENLEQDEKVLVFCNTRRRVDDLTASLRTQLEALGYEVRAHHGSLSQSERERAESAIKSQRRIVLIATSTLEIGIDIGDIDLVVLDGPPPDVPALLQRIGRGNRRTNRTRVMACSGSYIESIVQAAMIESARLRELGPVEVGSSYAVARQQIASYIMQSSRRTRRRRTLERLLDECAPEVVRRSLLDHLIATDELVEDREGVRLGEMWLERTPTGEIHSNIEGSPGTTVIDEESGRVIAVQVDFHGGRGLRVGGNLLEARRWCDRKLEVRATQDPYLADGSWGYHSRSWMEGIGQPDAVRRYLEVSEGTWPMVHKGTDTVVFHFGGGRRRAILELLSLRDLRARSWKMHAWLLQIPGHGATKPEWLKDVSAPLLELQLEAHLEQLERRLGRPSANRRLPRALRLDEVRSWLRLEEEVRAIQESMWLQIDDPDLRSVLRALISKITDP
ncbi:ATP-dependent RNA helicase DbpA [Candidatus Entotheonellaceae bacterium PAL068K]